MNGGTVKFIYFVIYIPILLLNNTTGMSNLNIKFGQLFA